PEADMSGFSGTNELGSSAGYYRFYGSLGSSAATFDLGTGGATMNNRNGNVTIQLGGLDGGLGTTLTGASAISAPTLYSIGGNNNDAVFAGAITDGKGTTAITKAGTGTWTVTGANTYSGGTMVSGGALVINNAAGSGTGSGAVTVNGGALAGDGSISGSVTVNAGGTLAPGNPMGVLAFSNDLTLASGSVTLVQAQHAPLADSAVNVSGTLTEGGTLVLSNSNSSVFAAGDTFKLFNAGAYSGAFGGYNLPALPPGLAWNTSGLNESGTLSVVALTSPVIGSVKAVNGNLIVSGTGGSAGLSYEIEAATNLLDPRWISVATNQFDASGNFAFTNAIDLDGPQSFYRLEAW
ncbi:MAG: autotransporter-associated beta strand repeat-containing protein, partial [Limisphaerales bacterium]